MAWGRSDGSVPGQIYLLSYGSCIATDERLTRAVVLGEAGPAGASVLQAGGEADGGMGPGQLVWPLGRKRSEERRALAWART